MGKILINDTLELVCSLKVLLFMHGAQGSNGALIYEFVQIFFLLIAERYLL